jgi:hypothetical protein
MSEDEEFEGTPQYYGFPENPTMANWQTWNRQQLFLTAYTKIGKIGKAAEAAGMSINTIESWQRRDLHGFKKRVQQAHQVYVESLEEELDASIKRDPVRMQIAQIFRLRAAWPEKYREEVKVLGVSAPFDMLDRLRELATKERRE